MSTKKPSPLRQLADLISTSVDKIDAIFEEKGLEYPDLFTPIDPTSASEAAARDPGVLQAVALAIAACSQLGATLHEPSITLNQLAMSYHIPSALRFVIETNCAEILRGQSQGLHVKDIAAPNGVDASRLARCLRLLAGNHTFKEVSPDVFANNRLSSVLDTGETVDELKSRSKEDKYTGTTGIAALYNHITDETFKMSAYLTDAFLDPVCGHSDDANKAALSLAFNTDKSFFEWYEEPGNEHRLRRFGVAMAGSAKLDAPDAILKGFPWNDLPPKSRVVDVGGGLGHITMTIARQYPELQYVVQDRHAVIPDTEKYWRTNFPQALDSGLVTLQKHDITDPQPIHDAAVFFLRVVIHVFGRSSAIHILSNLRASATPDTKLVLIEQIIPYACPYNDVSGHPVAGTKDLFPSPPPPLVNFGRFTSLGYLLDLQMACALNAEERTFGTWVELCRAGGWNITQVYPIPGSRFSHIVAVPLQD